MRLHQKEIALILAMAFFLQACKKNHEGATPATGTRLELSLDSLYLYAKETYLWYTDLPDYLTFHPRQYTSSATDLENLQAALYAITQLPNNPQTNRPYEYRTGYTRPLYSYIAEGNIITGQRGEVDLTGKGNDFGLGLAVVNNTDVYVRYVEQGSPSALADLSRGMKLLQIDGQPAPANTTALNALLQQPSITLTMQNKDGATFQTSLTKQSYTASPVQKTGIYTAGTKKVGYLVLARFSELSSIQAELQQIFTEFSNAGVTHLVIDLRYNSGGYVQTAEYLANLMAPASINNATMYAEHFNNLLQQGQAPILKSIPYLDNNRQPVYINGRPATYADVDYTVNGNTAHFKKTGALQSIRSMVFIVSGATASASELLINSFKPHINVKLVGSKTFGKPVGFFGIGIDLYTVYLSQFRIVNAAGEGDYYEGIQPDIAAVDDVTHDFGDPAEHCLSTALLYISTANRVSSPGKSIMKIVNVPDKHFTGMVERGRRLLP